MTAGLYNMRCEQGTTFKREIALTSVGDEEPIPLASYTALMQVRHDVTNDLLLTASTENGYITIDGDAGTLAINIPASVTGSLHASGVYELRIINTENDEVTAILKGKFILEDSIIE